MRMLPRLTGGPRDKGRRGSLEDSPEATDGGGDNPADILLVSQFFWPEPIGTPAYATDAARWLVEQGHRVTVLTGRPYYPDFRIKRGYETGQRDREVVDGVRVCRLPTIVPSGAAAAGRIVSEVNFLVRAALTLVTRTVRRRGSVISFCPSILTVLAGSMAVRRGGRHVAVVHDIQSGLAGGLGMVGNSIFLRLMRLVETIVLNRADHVIVLSEKMKAVLLAQGVRTRVEVVPLWADADKIHPIPRKPGRPPTVLYSGNLGLKQGVGQLIDLAEELMRRRPEIRVRIRGAGSQLESLRKSAVDRRLENVRFEPLVPFGQITESLSEGDVHLLPQDPAAADFAVPSKVYNIMAAGRPFVCTARPGSTLWDLRRECGGFVCVAPYDARAFADSVITLIDDAELRARMGALGRSYVEDSIARDLVLRQYAALLMGDAEAPARRSPETAPSITH